MSISFVAIEPVTALDVSGSANYFFGMPPGTSQDKWPRYHGTLLHHILTISVSQLKMPALRGAEAISVFHYFDFEDPGPSFEEAFSVILHTRESLRARAATFPSDYKKWWHDDQPLASLYAGGIPLKLTPVEGVSEAYIQERLASTLDPWEEEALPGELENLRSFMGGFPQWYQANSTPVDANGKRTHFLLQLDGYHPLLSDSVIGNAVVYLFLDDRGCPYWVAQTD